LNVPALTVKAGGAPVPVRGGNVRGLPIDEVGAGSEEESAAGAASFGYEKIAPWLARARRRGLYPAFAMTPEQRFAELRLTLPPAPKPVAVYKPLLVVDRTIYVSGHGPLRADKTLITGVVGRDLSLEEGYAAARQVGLAILATLREHLGGLDRVARLVKLLGMVNSAPDFYEHPKVINGCSELFAEVWGPEHGIGARSAVGMGPLPGNIAVEIEAIFQLA
jgi:enamine deaminase RidA (YjgF/YER057c/UK114 family)